MVKHISPAIHRGITGNQPIRQTTRFARYGLEGIENKELFDQLLSNALRQEGAGPGSGEGVAPIGRRELYHIIEVMRARMDDVFFDAFGEPDDDGPFSAGFLGWIGPSPLGSIRDLQPPNTQRVMNESMMSPQEPPQAIGDIISQAAETYGIDPDLVRAVIKAESDFDADTTSSKGAMGLMQLMPETASELGVRDPYDPVENVMGGARYLKSLLDRYGGQIPLALAAYNWGMGNVERHPGRLPQETRTYIARVNRYFGEIKRKAA